MTGDTERIRKELRRLADAFVEDILGASDEDILAEISEDSGDPAKLAADMRTLFERTSMEGGKAKLAAAKQAAMEARRKDFRTVSMDLGEMRRRYEKMLFSDTGPANRLTIAARKGEGQSERDIDSALEDLKELGAFDNDDSHETKS